LSTWFHRCRLLHWIGQVVHRFSINKCASTLEISDLVLAEKTLNAFGETSHDAGFSLLGLIPIDSGSGDIDTETLEVVVEFVVFVGNVEQSLGRDAADVQTSASQRSSLLDADSAESKLSSLDGGDVT
jgi:hypothetical protein